MNAYLKYIFYFIGSLILIVSYLTSTELEFYTTVIELPQSANAKCLDGTPYRFDYIKGFDEGINNFLIYFEGGGWCGSELRPTTAVESCRKRAYTPRGTNRGKFSFVISRLNRLLSTKKNYNPTFYNWNKIYIKYCDGLGHMSNLDKYGLYFRGINNTLGVLNYAIENFNLKSAKSLVVSGYSAGGIAALQWANYISQLTIRKNITNILVDSSLFISINPNNLTESELHLQKITKNLIKLSGNNTQILSTFCKENEEENLHKCYTPEIIIPDLHMPMLFLQNEYDSWMVSHLLGITCFFEKSFFTKCSEQDVEQIKKYGEKIQKRMKEIVNESSSNIVVWMPKTTGHMLTTFSIIWENEFYKVKNDTVTSVIHNWYNAVSKPNISNDNLDLYRGNLILSDETYEKLKVYKDYMYYLIAYDYVSLENY